MKAIILAAGIGSRLKPITDTVPKCLVKVLNKTILQYQIESYLKAGIKDIYIVTGYLSKKIEKFIEENYKDEGNIKIIYNKDYYTTNNMYSLYLAQEFIDSEFIISNADVVIHPDMINYILKNGYVNCIAVEKDNYNDEAMKLEVDGDKIINISKEIEKKNAYGTSIDVYKLGKEAKEKLFNIINKIIEDNKDKNSWTEVAIDILLKQIDFKPLNIKGRYYWYEIDNLDDLKNAEQIVKESIYNESL